MNRILNLFLTHERIISADDLSLFKMYKTDVIILAPNNKLII